MYAELRIGMKSELRVNLLESKILRTLMLKSLFLNGITLLTFMKLQKYLLGFIKKMKELRALYIDDHTWISVLQY